jgi:methylase of polypeptide subunit release factors
MSVDLQNRDERLTLGAMLAQDFRREFVCPEESSRYAGSLEQLVFSRVRKNSANAVIVEFGSGTGEPVVSAILNSGFAGVVHGYEINPEAAAIADELINQYGLAKIYTVHNSSFYESDRIPHADYLIANPPYIPCKDRTLLTLPDLCGGPDGNSVSKSLMSYAHDQGCPNVFLEVSSYSNPTDLIDHAKSLGYRLIDFQVTKMPMGVYSNQDVVQTRLHEMRREGKAHFTDHCYLVGSAFFTKGPTDEPELSSEFLACLTSIGKSKQVLAL